MELASNIRICNNILLHGSWLISASVALVYTPIITARHAIVAVATDAIDPSKSSPLTKQSIGNARAKLHNLADAFVTGDFVVIEVVSRVDVNI